MFNTSTSQMKIVELSLFSNKFYQQNQNVRHKIESDNHSVYFIYYRLFTCVFKPYLNSLCINQSIIQSMFRENPRAAIRYNYNANKQVFKRYFKLLTKLMYSTSVKWQCSRDVVQLQRNKQFLLILAGG